MVITDNPVLTTVSSLHNVVRVHGFVDIERNAALTDVFSDALIEVEGQMVIADNNSLAHLDYPKLEHVLSVLEVLRNGALQTLEMPALTEVAQELFIQSNPQLRTIAFDALEHADVFVVNGNPRLPACQVLALFERVRGFAHSQSGNDNTAPCMP
jgi:hypothetical protein